MLGTVLLPDTTEQNTIGTIDCSFDPGHMSRYAFITIRSDTGSALSHAIVVVLKHIQAFSIPILGHCLPRARQD